MRSVASRLFILGLAAGIPLIFGCTTGQETGLLTLSISPDPTNPPPPATRIVLTDQSGKINRTYIGPFPPSGDGGVTLVLEFPKLPAGDVTLTVQAFAANGCLVGTNAAPISVTIKAGAETGPIDVKVSRISAACEDAGVPDGSADGSNAPIDGSVVGVDSADGLGEPADATKDAQPATDAPVVLDSAVDVPIGSDGPAGAGGTGGAGGASGTGGTGGVGGTMSGGSTGTAGLDAANDVGQVQGTDTPPDTPGTDAMSDIASPAPPAIVSFKADPATISVGASATLTAVFVNAIGATVSRGIGTITSGNGVSTGPLTVSTTYTLTVTNATGDSTTAQATVTVVPLPVISSFTAGSTSVALGSATTLTATFTSGTGVIDNGIGSVSSGISASTGSLANAGDTIYTLTVTNPAGDSVTAKVTLAVAGFVTTGSMTTTRRQHAATLLADGKVLVTGGFGDSGGAYLSSGELYDSQPGTFTALASSMTKARYCHTSTLLTDGRVLIAGGDILNSSSLANADLYTPSTKQFTASASVMSVPLRLNATATLLKDGKVLVAGGDNNDTAFASADLYDPTIDTFITLSAQMTSPRRLHTATLLANGKVLLAGGATANGSGSILASADLYDPSARTFTAIAFPMSASRAGHTGTLLANGKVLLAGGTGGTALLTSADLYDPVSNTFLSSPSAMTTARSGNTATLLTNGNVVFAGGSASGSGGPLSSAELYDQTIPGFTALAASMNARRAYHTATLLANGEVLLAGGYALSTAAELFVY